MFSDLESDYINPIDLCNKLNQVSQTFFFRISDLQGIGVVCPSGVRCTRIPCPMFPIIRTMDSTALKCTSFGL